MGERFALPLVDQTLKRQGIGLFTDMPVGSPGKLTKGRDAASFGHARQAEIEPIREQPRHENAAVGDGLAGAQMRETIGKERPARHFGQQIGDADTWQRGVKTRGQRFGFRRRRLFDR
jgi:hypothetical protein